MIKPFEGGKARREEKKRKREKTNWTGWIVGVKILSLALFSLPPLLLLGHLTKLDLKAKEKYS